MMKTSRNTLLIGLALLLSPIPGCAQMVCDIDCSLQSAVRREVGTGKEATYAHRGEDADAPSAHRHCDEDFAAAGSAQNKHERVQYLSAACHGAKCATDLGQRVSSTAKIKPGTSTGLATTVEVNGRHLMQSAGARKFPALDQSSATSVFPRVGVLRI